MVDIISLFSSTSRYSEGQDSDTSLAFHFGNDYVLDRVTMSGRAPVELFLSFFFFNFFFSPSGCEPPPFSYGTDHMDHPLHVLD